MKLGESGLQNGESGIDLAVGGEEVGGRQGWHRREEKVPVSSGGSFTLSLSLSFMLVLFCSIGVLLNHLAAALAWVLFF